jgi:hypothetical protein
MDSDYDDADSRQHPRQVRHTVAEPALTVRGQPVVQQKSLT